MANRARSWTSPRFFDNILPTALALRLAGCDWGFVAYAVGFGGSMIRFGSSAGVALANQYLEAKSVGQWLRHGRHVAIAYGIGLLVMLAVLGWHPDPPHRKAAAPGQPAAVAALPAAPSVCCPMLAPDELALFLESTPTAARTGNGPTSAHGAQVQKSDA